MIAFSVPVLCLIAGIGAGNVLPQGAAGDDLEAGAPQTLGTVEVASLSLGSFTFPVEQPRHVTYVVARLSAGFAGEDAALHHSEPENLVRLRDAVFDAVLDARTDAATGEVDLEALSARLERTLSGRMPELVSIDVSLLGTRDVPRR
ncbi:hypothetical protein P6F26_09365 [Roseibacterium sp. SDUM158017]|uniref:hypothetical protein n=1 Tax=Roseicyclus salinarum TaxID=3036773 RepID=UPI0024150DD3|nr:hypothetical protein [Roseibacterium sp. SDUM158017]MDG4648655.1 hypothetical protein [Roseibacterium sp. SDUM158017]